MQFGQKTVSSVPRIDSEMKTLHDLYQCPICDANTAENDIHCRGCGIKFNVDLVRRMKTNSKFFVGMLPWNLRDVYRCLHCDAHIGIEDQYCRKCGDQICDQEKQLMKLRMKEIARDNLPALFGFVVFMSFVMLLGATLA